MNRDPIIDLIDGFESKFSLGNIEDTKSSYDIFRLLPHNQKISIEEYGLEHLERLLAQEKKIHARQSDILLKLILLKREWKNNKDSINVESILNSLDGLFDD